MRDKGKCSEHKGKHSTKGKITMSRQGLHKPGMARLQFYIEPHTKILLALIGQEYHFETMTDALNGLIVMAAKAKGIITDDGRVQPSYINRYKAEAALIKKTK